MKLKSSYLRNFVSLLSGSIIVQIINLLISPLITRLFSPDVLGLYALVLSVTNLFGGVICGRFEMVIVTTDEEYEINALIVVSFIISVLLSILVTFFFSLYIYFDDGLNYSIGLLSLLILPMLLLHATNMILEAYLNRKKQYKLIAGANIRRASLLSISQIVFGLLNFNIFSLLNSYIISILASISNYTKVLKDLIEINISINSDDLKKVFKKYINQPFYSTPALFINSLSYALLPFMLNSLYNTHEVGLFSLSFRLLGVPLTLISANISKVFFQKASEEFNQGLSFRLTYIKTTLLLLVISLPTTVFLYLFSENLIGFVFGEQWKNAGIYVKYLAPMYGIRLLVSSLTVTLIITQKQKYDILMQLLFLLSSISIYIYANNNNLEPRNFIILISTFFSISYIIYGIIAFKFSGSRIDQVS